MNCNNPPPRRELESTVGGRIASVLVSLLFSFPAALLLWIVFNARQGFFTATYIPFEYLVYGVIAFSAFAFVFPRFVPGILGKVWSFVLWIGKGW